MLLGAINFMASEYFLKQKTSQNKKNLMIFYEKTNLRFIIFKSGYEKHILEIFSKIIQAFQ